MTTIRVAAIAGACLSLYALYTKELMEKDPSYTPTCDVDMYGFHASCSRVFNSPYSYLLSLFNLVQAGGPFDLSLSFMGLFYYLGMFLFASILPPTLILAASMPSLVLSLYLAYVMRYILMEFCLVCASMYICNLLIFIGAARSQILQIRRSSKSKKN
jgi:uncharacterized membrane protein